jgi:hypothetical protein
VSEARFPASAARLRQARIAVENLRNIRLLQAVNAAVPQPFHIIAPQKRRAANTRLGARNGTKRPALGLLINRSATMPKPTTAADVYKILPHRDGWTIDRSGNAEGSYKTKEAAFEAAVMAASNSIKRGHEVAIHVPAPEAGEATLG